MNLNPEQQRAIETTEGPCLVLAGAGSGKTRVVTHRMIHLLEKGVKPWQILGLTFTNKAAQEMQERIRTLTSHQVLICTFHSLGVRILRQSSHHLGFSPDFIIYDQEDADKVLKSCLKEEASEETKLDAKTFRKMISKAKNARIAPDQVDCKDLKSEEERLFPAIYTSYQKKLKEFNALDFDDLLFLTTDLFLKHPEVLKEYQEKWHYIHIDEYQDTNNAQYTIIKQLATEHNNVFAVGDPDQSIYSWRGANINNILHFEKDFSQATVIKLEQNYRSSTHILDGANALITHNESRYKKELWSDLGQGEKIIHFTAQSDRDEGEFVANQIAQHKNIDQIPLSEIAIFYRTNAQSRIIEDILLSRKVPYVIVGGVSFYQRREIKDLLAFLKMSISSQDFVSFARTLNLPKRGIGATTLQKLAQHAAKEGQPIFTYCEALVDETPLNFPLRLSTRQKNGLTQYVQLIRQLRQSESSLSEQVMNAITLTDYLVHLKSDPESFQERKDNLDQLASKAFEWESAHSEPTLSGFLEELSLRTTLDEANNEQERVSLMTIHNGKGLEYTLVFLIGLEEDLFPHVNSRSSASAQEEERRLCYVGMTRAKRLLYLTNSLTRFLWGSLRSQRPSRFLREVPQEHKQNSLPKEASSAFQEGDHIFHQDFGIGVINDIYDTSLGLTYKIFFSNESRERSIVAKYASIKALN